MVTERPTRAAGAVVLTVITAHIRGTDPADPPLSIWSHEFTTKNRKVQERRRETFVA